MERKKGKKGWIAAMLLLGALALSACGGGGADEGAEKPSAGAAGAASAEGLTVKIGVQGKGGLFGKAQEEKWFEDAFGKLGAKVEWIEFQSGPPMVEAMASSHLDFAGMGNMPPISAQAAGVKFKIVSQVLEGRNNVALIVPQDSPIQSVADLKGKKVAVTKGSNAYNFLYRLLDAEGLSESDLQVIQLQPDETQPAFEGGKVDAWATWDPYITLNALSGKGRVIADGASSGILSPSFQLVRAELAEQHPELVTLYLKVLQQAIEWEKAHQEEAFQRYADERGIPLALVQGMQERSAFINISVTDEVIAEQQQTADFQFELGTIRKGIDVKEVFDNRFVEEALKQAEAEASGGK
ncbi:aliphatic sulfonate ABC transporter substrate-binding protein [Paenibacillus pasadenensis]|uniref:aliphatic sulfonate ABC transporter substrate-binding protein n=1 Tax=Paenibacillus TaxID=44249 RepID=UPI00041B4CF9|nr:MULTISPECIES: aliphatic sulfonate ABC transporter substrate-binding protein [Paenibacillus]QGG54918.1 aliphatic sulfonate ABC transporter substrate-binding protein [Paenibacillus sp. B01]